MMIEKKHQPSKNININYYPHINIFYPLGYNIPYHIIIYFRVQYPLSYKLYPLGYNIPILIYNYIQ